MKSKSGILTIDIDSKMNTPISKWDLHCFVTFLIDCKYPKIAKAQLKLRQFGLIQKFAMCLKSLEIG